MTDFSKQHALSLSRRLNFGGFFLVIGRAAHQNFETPPVWSYLSGTDGISQSWHRLGVYVGELDRHSGFTSTCPHLYEQTVRGTQNRR